MWKVYILFSKKFKTTYTGSTNDFQRRLREHNDGLVKSTSKFKPWIPIYLEFYPTENDARLREKFFKSAAGRRLLKKIIDEIIQAWVRSSVG